METLSQVWRIYVKVLRKHKVNVST